MNLILVSQQDFIDTDIVLLTDRRFEHIRHIHQAQLGQSLSVALINDKIGTGVVLAIDDASVTLRLELTEQPPSALNLTLILALPRPKMLKRILQNVSALGVKDIYLINSYKVDKSYWSTPILQPPTAQAELQLGLEQAVDSHMPNIYLKKRFKPFVEDELSEIASNSRKLVAHPYQSAPCPRANHDKTTLVIGPEGGFIEYEIDKLQQLGFSSISLGHRILKVETAIAVAIAKLCVF
ncbi:16S rRNA (uracil(1498)-N(3))-methyltransferase [Gammaproteobacteria bacterium AS21]